MGLPQSGQGGVLPVLDPEWEAADGADLVPVRPIEKRRRLTGKHIGIVPHLLHILVLHGLFAAALIRENVGDAFVQGKAAIGRAGPGDAAKAGGGSEDAVYPQKTQAFVPSVQHQKIRQPAAAFWAAILSGAENVYGTVLCPVPLDEGITCIEIQLPPLPGLVKGPAAAWAYTEGPTYSFSRQGRGCCSSS